MLITTLCVAAILVISPCTPPEDDPPEEEPPSRLTQAQREVLTDVSREVLRDQKSPRFDQAARDAGIGVMHKALVEFLNEILDPSEPADSPEFRQSIENACRNWISQQVSPPQVGLPPDEGPPALAAGPARAAPSQGPASPRAPAAPSGGKGAGVAERAGQPVKAVQPVDPAPLPPPGPTPDPSQSVALAGAIARLKAEQQPRFDPLLNAVLGAETARQTNWTTWDSYRVNQWQLVFTQSYEFSRYIFVAVHFIVGLALLMSWFEFVRAGRINEQKAEERKEKREHAIAILKAMPAGADAAALAKAVQPAEEVISQETEMEISANKLVMKTSIMGFVMMAFALAFYALFIVYVYPVTPVKQ
jgi:hypothetical protein